MQEIWLLLKIFEVCGSIICMYLHVLGFERESEPLPHNLIYCGTFFGFFLVPMVGILSTCLGHASTLWAEIIANIVGAVLYFIASILSMYNAEHDYHLIYFSDFEELSHAFFFFCKWQSISALSCAALHLLHSILAMDVLLTHDELHTGLPKDQTRDDEVEYMKVTRLYIFGQGMQEIWLVFKLLEVMLAISCTYFHVLGILNYTEPLPHYLIYCGTYFGYTLLTALGICCIIHGDGFTTIIEAIISASAAFMFVLTSLLSMHDAEKDGHLLYITDWQEPAHPFFTFCKAQSVCALAAGLLYFLHAVFATDVILGHRRKHKPRGPLGFRSAKSAQPIRMYVFGKKVHKQFKTFRWFRRLRRS